ncbi:hypothetical protein ACS0TY_007122 [Phlomoides rotata]
MLIDPHKMEVCLFDSLYHGNHSTPWKLVVEMALHMFNATMQKKGKIKWNVLKVLKKFKEVPTIAYRTLDILILNM